MGAGTSPSIFGFGAPNYNALVFGAGFTPVSLTGTFATTDASTAIVGTGTLFITELDVDDWIKLDADGELYWRQVASITDDLNLVLAVPYSGTNVTASGSKRTLSQPGFFFLALQTGVYFDSIRLENPEPFWEDRSPILNISELLSGQMSIQSSPDTYDRPLRISFRCQTTIHGNISLLLAKIGAPHTLLIDEFVYENCYISSLREHEWFPGEFEFEISFVQDTT